MNWKKAAKKFALLNWMNAKLKSYQLRRDISRLRHEYDTKSVLSGYIYDEDHAVEEFIRRHKKHCPYYKSRPYGALRIFWVGANRDQDESGFLQALQRMGKVTVFQNIEGKYGLWYGDTSSTRSNTFSDIRQANDTSLLQQVAHVHATHGIDVLLGQMWAGLLSIEALAEVQSMGVPVINISMDDRLPVHWTKHGEVRLGSVGLAPSLDLVLTTSPETCQWYGIEGCPALFWPLASDPGLFKPPEGSLRDIDVLFIGSNYGVRGQIVQYLKKHGVKVDCYGSGWPNGHVNAERMTQLSKRAKIILGIGAVGHGDDVYTLKLRDFDAPMSGAMYLTHRNPDLCNIYKEGVEIEFYREPNEALNKIKFYLEHPLQRAAIAKKGNQKALSRDTWDKRLITTFERIGLLQCGTSSK